MRWWCSVIKDNSNRSLPHLLLQHWNCSCVFLYSHIHVHTELSIAIILRCFLLGYCGISSNAHLLFFSRTYVTHLGPENEPENEPERSLSPSSLSCLCFVLSTVLLFSFECTITAKLEPLLWNSLSNCCTDDISDLIVPCDWVTIVSIMVVKVLRRNLHTKIMYSTNWSIVNYINNEQWYIEKAGITEPVFESKKKTAHTSLSLFSTTWNSTSDNFIVHVSLIRKWFIRKLEEHHHCESKRNFEKTIFWESASLDRFVPGSFVRKGWKQSLKKVS